MYGNLNVGVTMQHPVIWTYTSVGQDPRASLGLQPLNGGLLLHARPGQACSLQMRWCGIWVDGRAVTASRNTTSAEKGSDTRGMLLCCPSARQLLGLLCGCRLHAMLLSPARSEPRRRRAEGSRTVPKRTSSMPHVTETSGPLNCGTTRKCCDPADVVL